MNTQRACLIIGTLTLFAVGSDIFMASPLLPFIANEFQLTTGYTGWMVTFYAITYALCCPLWGSLSDRQGRKHLIIAGLLGLILANFLASQASSFTLLVVWRMLSGLSLSLIAPLVYAMIGDVAPPGKKGFWLSIGVAGNLTGLVIGTPIGSTIQYFFDWRTVYFTLSIAGLLLLIANILLLPKNKPNSTTEKRNTYSLKHIIASVSVTAIWSMAVYGVYTYLGTGLYAIHRYTSLEIGRLLLFYGIGAVLGSILAGKLVDRLGAKVVSSTTLFGLGISLMMVGLFFQKESYLYMLIFLWTIIGYGYIPSYQARLVGEYPKEKGRIMAWNISAMYIGMALGAFIGGIIETNYNFIPLPLIFGMVAFLAGTLSLKVKSYHFHPHTETN